EAGTLKSWFFTEPPTALGLTDRPDTLLVALASKVILWQPRNDARADFAMPVKDWPGVRLNDGRPDPAGNFWVGSMQNNGAADGSAMDRDGFLWNARYGGGCIVRVGRDGKVDRIVDMPVGNITTCTFGGADLRTLYITTAQGGSGPGERLAGGLYALTVDT